MQQQQQQQKSSTFGYVGRVFSTKGSLFRSGLIENSAIRLIPDPVDAQDPVTLRYLQNTFSQNLLTATPLTLSDTMWIDVPENAVPWYGNFTVTINALEEFCPNAQWQIARASSQDQGVITQGVFSPMNSDCVLQIRWLPQTLLQIRKTTSDYNGTYYIKTT